jgi:hypothetical protein
MTVDARAVRLAMEVARVSVQRDAALRDAAHWKALAAERYVPDLVDDGQANYCTHGSATGVDTAPIGPDKVWACDHCGLRWTDQRGATS